MTDPDKPCPHADFHADVDITPLADDADTVIGYTAAIQVRCSGCGEAFRWNGVQAGMSQTGPRCSVDETVLHAPMRPASADPDFGMGIPGFAIGYQGVAGG